MNSRRNRAACVLPLIAILTSFACLGNGKENAPMVYETEVRVGIYDVEVFKAIDQVRDRLQKADKDLATLRNELSYKETQKKLWK